MHPSVHAAWHRFSEPFEGRVLNMYLDVFGKVTTGVGNLIDTVSEAQKLPWKHQGSGYLAAPDEVADAWRRLKARQDLRKRGTSHALALTGLVLTNEDVDALVARKLASNNRELSKFFPGFESMPADAQLGILSIAWAVGPAFSQKFPLFTAAANAGRWADAAAHGKIKDEDDRGTPNEDDDIPNPGVIPRNKANKLCLLNAGDVLAQGTDRTVLHWPNRYPAQLATPEDPPPLEPPVPSDRSANLLGVRTLETLKLGMPDPNDETEPEGEVFSSEEPPTKDETPRGNS